MITRYCAYRLFRFMKNKYYEYIYEQFRKKYTIDKDVFFNGKGIHLYGDGEIIIRKNSSIGRYSSIQAEKDWVVYIGENVKISHFVLIYTDNKNSKDFSLRDGGNVIIRDNCWIGAHVLIKQGVKLGDGCVVGANSVVTKSFPNNCIIGGVPARLIKRR